MSGSAIIFDHIAKQVIQVGETPESRKRYDQLVAAQASATSGGTK